MLALACAVGMALAPACASEVEKDKAESEVEAVRGRDPAGLPAGADAKALEVPSDWGVGEAQGCAWAWAPPKDVTTHMKAAADGIKNWSPTSPGATSKAREAQWDQLLDVAIDHASVAMAAAVSDPGAAISPDGKTNAIDAAWKATTMLDDAVRANTPEGKSPGWARWNELSYLREVLRSMSGDYLVQPLAKRASDMRFAVQDPVWRPRIDGCRAHRLQMSARKPGG